MASPIGHALAGYIGYQGLATLPVKARDKWQLVGAIALANMPDLDFIPGLLIGQFKAFHRLGSHSLLSAAAVGMAVALGTWLWGRWRQSTRAERPRCLVWGTWSWLLYAGHIGIDLIVIDRLPPQGLQLLWPLSDQFFVSPVMVLPGLTFEPVLSWQNCWAVGTEILVFLPIALAARAVAQRSGSFNRAEKGSSNPIEGNCPKAD